MSYRPLPESLTIKPSGIDGLGLFAAEDIPIGKELGICHVEDDRFENGYIRTPLGGFYNHSDNPNCESYRCEDYVKLKSTREIKEGEELTANYWLYKL
jgi:hypothetical protein